MYKELLKKKLNELILTGENASKWAPRKDSKGAGPLRYVMKLNEANWRKYVVSASNTVEQLMCAKEWESIEYDKLPSVASARYQKAFGKNDPVRYGNFKESLVKGETTVNAGAVFPYDLTRSAVNGDDIVSTAQWNALPNYFEGSNERFLPVIDVSGSMFTKVGSTTAVEVAISLGMYCAERNNSVFKNQFITFTDVPAMIEIKGKALAERYTNISRADWGMNTDLEAVFDLVLSTAVRNKLTNEDLPTKIFIVSDMRFDVATGGGTAFEMIESKYKNSGYTMPGVVFWNVCDRGGNIPVTMNQDGVALVSGFSPTIVKSVLGGELDPMEVMVRTLESTRYDY